MRRKKKHPPERVREGENEMHKVKIVQSDSGCRIFLDGIELQAVTEFVLHGSAPDTLELTVTLQILSSDVFADNCSDNLGGNT